MPTTIEPNIRLLSREASRRRSYAPGAYRSVHGDGHHPGATVTGMDATQHAALPWTTIRPCARDSSCCSGRHDDLELVGSGRDRRGGARRRSRLHPQVVIMDVRLPGIDGISTVKRIAQAAPDVQIVIFSAYGDKRLLSDAIAAGARGYVMKGSPPEDLIRAIRTVTRATPFVDPSLSPTLLMTDGRRGRPALRARAGDPPASGRRPTTPRRSPAGSGSQRRDGQVGHEAGDRRSSRPTAACTPWRSRFARL